MFWLACAAYRLARFNVTIDPLADKRYFVGLASPGAAGVVIATVLAIGEPLYDWAPLLPVAAGVLPAALMATSFRFRSFRDLLSPRHLRISVPLGIVLVLGLIFFPGTTALMSPTATCSRARWAGSRRRCDAAGSAPTRWHRRDAGCRR